MSRETIIIKCTDCDREVYRRDTGELRNDNGVVGTVIKTFNINKQKCPYCRGIKSPEE